MGVPPIFTPGSKPKKGIPLDQGYGKGVPLIFTPGSKPKKGIPLDQGYGRGVPQVFTPGSKPNKGTPLPFFGFDPGVKIGGTPLP